MYILNIDTNFYYFKGPHPFHLLKLGTIFSLVAPTWELQLCTIESLKFCWNKEDIFIQVFTLKLISTYKWLVTKYVDDSELNCHQHQGVIC